MNAETAWFVCLLPVILVFVSIVASMGERRGRRRP